MTDSSFREIATSVAQEAEVKPQETSSESSPANDTPQEAPQQVETFAEDKDLTGMTPEQLLAQKKEWERAYTQKRQKETAEIKEYQKRIQELEQRTSQFPASQSQGIEERALTAQRQVELGQMSVPEYTEYMQNLMAEQAREIAREEYLTLQHQERENSLATKALDSFTNADPRLNEHSPQFDASFKAEVQREVADLLDQHLAEYGSYEGFDADALTKSIVERKDKQLDEIIKLRTQQSTQGDTIAKQFLIGVLDTKTDWFSYQ